MSLLMRNYAVTTRYGGGFVESIDGFAGGHAQGEPLDWFYYVNGVEADRGAAATTVHPGDRIWWDLHEWGQTAQTPAVVGSFPAPFVRGIEGKRLPVRVECAARVAAACQTVASRLAALGIPAGVAAPGASGEVPHVLRIAVGPWPTMRTLPAAAELEQGPASSGVYVRVAHGGHTFALLDEHGAVTSTLAAGAGLIAALRYPDAAPVWVVTGTDAAGVSAAANAFTESALDGHFAVAIAPGGHVLPLPSGSQP